MIVRTMLLMTMAAASAALADSVLDRLPPFDARLAQAPLVVVGTMIEPVATSSKAFRDAREPFVEVYTHYLVKIDRILKGAYREETVEVRVLGGTKNNLRTERRSTLPEATPAVYLLTPDVGLDPSTGRPRDTYVIVHDTVMPIRGNTATLENDGERRTIGLTALVDQIARQERERALRAERAEPAYAHVPVDPGSEARARPDLPPAVAVERVKIPLTGAAPGTARPSEREQPRPMPR